LSGEWISHGLPPDTPENEALSIRNFSLSGLLFQDVLLDGFGGLFPKGAQAMNRDDPSPAPAYPSQLH